MSNNSAALLFLSSIKLDTGKSIQGQPKEGEKSKPNSLSTSFEKPSLLAPKGLTPTDKETDLRRSPFEVDVSPEKRVNESQLDFKRENSARKLPQIRGEYSHLSINIPKSNDALNFLSNIKVENYKSPVKTPQESPNSKHTRFQPIHNKNYEKITSRDIREKFELVRPFSLYFYKKGTPAISSTIFKYQHNEEEERRKDIKKTQKEASYDEMLENPTMDDYDPNYLDDPSMGIGKKRQVMNLTGFISSMIPFVRKEEVMEDLNESFNEKHPNIAFHLSLSDIRDIKMKMFSSMTDVNTSVIEMSSIAIAIVYLEKLIIKGFVTRQNRWIVAAVCLMLAIKYNENIKDMSEFFDEVESSFGITKKKILESEWTIFAEELQFNLSVHQDSFIPHLKQLLFLQGTTLEEFL